MSPPRAEIVRQLDEKGYTVISGISLEDADAGLRAAIEQVGRPVSFFDQPLIMDVRPRRGNMARSYAGTGSFELHTDLTFFASPPRWIAMLCLRNESAGGGIPLLVDGLAVLAKLAPEDLQTLKTTSVIFRPPDHVTSHPVTCPVVAESGKGWCIRFRGDLLSGDVPPAFHRFQTALESEMFQLPISPGEIYVADNCRMLHGRTALKAGYDSDRHFKRIYAEESK